MHYLSSSVSVMHACPVALACGCSLLLAIARAALLTCAWLPLHPLAQPASLLLARVSCAHGLGLPCACSLGLPSSMHYLSRSRSCMRAWSPSLAGAQSPSLAGARAPCSPTLALADNCLGALLAGAWLPLHPSLGHPHACSLIGLSAGAIAREQGACTRPHARRRRSAGGRHRGPSATHGGCHRAPWACVHVEAGGHLACRMLHGRAGAHAAHRVSLAWSS